MISLRHEVFEFMEDNPEASNDDIYDEFDAENKKEKDTVRRYRNQFLQEEKKKSSSGTDRDIPNIPDISHETLEKVRKFNPSISSISYIPKKSHGTSQNIPEHVKIAWNDLRPSIASIFKESKWPSKFASFQIFNNWMEELLKNE